MNFRNVPVDKRINPLLRGFTFGITIKLTTLVICVVRVKWIKRRGIIKYSELRPPTNKPQHFTVNPLAPVVSKPSYGCF